jgi:tetratricopeptide (TPR) repeat protein
VPLPADIEARLRYTLSMLYNNQGATKNALAQALDAAALYRQASDDRGLARALSQVANQRARDKHLDEAKSAAQEALRIARELGSQRLLADVLRRCALSFSKDGPERVRAMYEESVALFRTLGHDDDTARALTWWGQFEAKVGDYGAAVKRFIEAIPLAGEDLATTLAGDVAGCYLLMGDRANALLSVREALALSANLRDSMEIAFSVSYTAALAVDSDPIEAARLIAYAEERLRIAGWERLAYDRAMVDGLQNVLGQRLSNRELLQLSTEGATMTEEEAVARAIALVSSFDTNEGLAAT